jgi:hypothetical protein
MQNTPILDAGALTNGDFMNVTTNNRLWPDRTMGANTDITNNGGLVIHHYTGMDFWVMFLIRSNAHGFHIL